MEAVRQWAFSICATMAACGIALQIMPKSNLTSVFKLVVSVFFLCCLLSPIIIQFPNMRIELEEYSQSLIDEKAARLTKVIDNQAQAEASQKAQKIIADKLRQMGINYHSITININTNGQSEQAASIDIILDKSHEPENERLVQRLKNELGADVRLGYSDGE